MKFARPARLRWWGRLLRDPWADFLHLPERAETGQRYELHDDEVILAPPAKPLHIKLQKRIEQLLEALEGRAFCRGR